MFYSQRLGKQGTSLSHCIFKKFLFERQREEGVGEGNTEFISLVYSPSACNSQGWPRLKPRNQHRSPGCMSSTESPELPSTASQSMHSQDMEISSGARIQTLICVLLCQTTT